MVGALIYRQQCRLSLGFLALAAAHSLAASTPHTLGCRAESWCCRDAEPPPSPRIPLAPKGKRGGAHRFECDTGGDGGAALGAARAYSFIRLDEARNDGESVAPPQRKCCWIPLQSDRGATPGGDVESSRVKVLVCCVLQITSMAQLLSQGLEAFTDFFDRHGGE